MSDAPRWRRPLLTGLAVIGLSPVANATAESSPAAPAAPTSSDSAPEPKASTPPEPPEPATQATPSPAPTASSAPANSTVSAGKTETPSATLATETADAPRDTAADNDDPDRNDLGPSDIPLWDPDKKPEAKIELGATLGVAGLAADHADFEYSEALVYGGFARIVLSPQLKTRLAVSAGSFDITLASNALTPGSQFGSSSLESLRFSYTLEPRWSLTERSRLWGASGASWTRVVNPAIDSSGAGALRLESRNASLFSTPFSIGFDQLLLDGWLVGSLSAKYEWMWDQRGSLFGSSSVVDRSGSLNRDIIGFPEFDLAYDIQLSLSVRL